MTKHIDTFSLNKIIWKGLIITNEAAIQILKLMKKNNNCQGLFLNIKKSGCAGFSYFISLIRDKNQEYLIFENNGAKLFTPLKIMPFIDGTKIDYIHDGLNEVFKFYNPKANHSCGCGESFNI